MTSAAFALPTADAGVNPATVTVRERLARAAALATAPVLPEDFLDLFAPLRRGADLRGRVVSIDPETRDAVTVVIKPGRGWTSHVPGQYIRIGIDVDGVRQWRAYSLTSPLDADHISITVKAIPDGVVSNYLVRRARPGMLVHLDQAAGEFTLARDESSQRDEPLLFVTAGSGITPVMGMLRNGTHRERDVVVLHSAPTKDDVIFGAELRWLAATDKVRLVELHTDTDGMLDADRLVELVPDLAERATYACGPAGMLDALEELFEAKGIAEQLHTERFRPTIIVTGEGGAVTYGAKGPTVEVGPGTTLLDAGEANGVLMKSGCRMGICFGCVVPLKEGAVRDLRNGDITTAVDGDGVRIQACISTAAGSCELDI
jgi:ferredoxin-NADP reductase